MGGAAAAPLVLPLMALQTLAGSWLPDLVTPLVSRLYAAPVDRPAPEASPAGDAVLAHEALASPPRR